MTSTWRLCASPCHDCELRPLAGCVQASFAAVYQRERSLGYWVAGETPLPPDMVKKIKAKSPAA